MHRAKTKLARLYAWRTYRIRGVAVSAAIGREWPWPCPRAAPNAKGSLGEASRTRLRAHGVRASCTEWPVRTQRGRRVDRPRRPARSQRVAKVAASAFVRSCVVHALRRCCKACTYGPTSCLRGAQKREVCAGGTCLASALFMATPTTPRPMTLVVAIDFSPLSDQALAVAKSLAARCAPAVVHALHVVPQLEIDSALPTLHADLAAAGLERLRAHLVERGMAEGVEAHAEVGLPSTSIPHLARAVHADVIVMGTHGRTGLARLVMGSVAETVMRGAPCSVLVVRERELGPEEKIEPARPGQNMHEHHARGILHQESPNVASSQYGMGALTFRP